MATYKSNLLFEVGKHVLHIGAVFWSFRISHSHIVLFSYFDLLIDHSLVQV